MTPTDYGVVSGPPVQEDIIYSDTCLESTNLRDVK